MKAKILLMLKALPKAPIESQIVPTLEELRQRFPEDVILGAGVLESMDSLAGSVHGKVMAGTESYDVVLTAESDVTDFQSLAKAFAGVKDLFGAMLDRAQSAVIAGVEHAITRGAPDACDLVFALRRRADLTMAQCQDYWLSKHSNLARGLEFPPPNYRQLHALEAASGRAASLLGFGFANFDGAALVSIPNVGALMTSDQGPASAAETALEDEKRFADHKRSAWGVYRSISLS
jgi:hypothetical protein